MARLTDPTLFGQVPFSGFSWEGGFEAFASNPNVYLYLQPCGSACTGASAPTPTSTAPVPIEPLVTVPNVVGQIAEYAETEIVTEGLQYTVQYDPNNPPPMFGVEEVESQDPAPGTELPVPNGVVTLVLGAGATSF